MASSRNADVSHPKVEFLTNSIFIGNVSNDTECLIYQWGW